MGDFFGTLKRQIDANAKRVVEECVCAIPDYHAIASEAHDSMLEFAITVRRRSIELAAANEPLLESDLAYIESVGEQRGAQGVSVASQRSVLALHAAGTFREMSEAAGPSDLGDSMHMLGWLARQGTAAQQAHTRGHLRGRQRHLSLVTRVRLLATMLLRDDPMAAELARSLAMPVAEHYLVTVIRVAGQAPPMPDSAREQVARTLLEQHRVPLGWCDAEEFAALVPCRSARSEDSAAAEGHGLALGRDFAGAVGRPCSVGTARGRTRSLAEAAALARKVSRVAPVERVPRRTYGLSDVFAELGASHTPQVDRWLREVARRLCDGPDLVITLDAYYRNDMNRLRTATSLHIHPRTLDYRLRRVRELTAIDPGTTRGVRVLSTAVARMLAGAWNGAD
ncbi:PucR family transcriptional regulator [Nonomuraea jiangxiensis]|uniref:PucR C-terminal helix-turn-helix domain-containing protein n=1 Tax=Nonomuraea jiangxiensis TaxID=633440 RepID=A0A1G9R1N5_9ACTN|nr:PucR family transcriptional regulator [Nonomuraea jiangxiensis]SDM17020.1 PucR C-terminal helix-turn-helix domain-containing protein [Nonomuraea jiangxiensis]